MSNYGVGLDERIYDLAVRIERTIAANKKALDRAGNFSSSHRISNEARRYLDSINDA